MGMAGKVIKVDVLMHTAKAVAAGLGLLVAAKGLKAALGGSKNKTKN